MAPRKAAEKPGIRIVDVKPKRGVRKKVPTAKSQAATKLKSLPIIDSFVPGDGNQDQEIVPRKVTKAKVAKKYNINRIKTIKDCTAANEEEANIWKDLPAKNKKVKSASKQILNETKTVQDGKDLVKPSKTEAKDVPPRIKKTKLANKQNQVCHSDEVTNDPYNSENVSAKVKKVRGTYTRNRKQPKLTVAKKNITAGDLKDSPDDVARKTKKSKATYKPNQNEIKMMLANEVVRSAFQKKPTIVKNPPRPGLRKKTICTADNCVQDLNKEPNKILDGHEHTQDVAEKKVPLEVSSELTVPEEIPKKRRTLSLRRKTLKPAIEQTSPNIDTGVEGKEETQEIAPIDSNATFLNSDGATALDSTSKTDSGLQSQKPSNVSCRKNSGASTSTCFSWTKDISSSSSITCVTVNSNDFVRIDKKIPIVKLTNVNHKIKNKHSIDHLFEENSIDSHKEKSKCPSECISVSIANLNVSRTINLSTSSLTSVTTNRTSQKNCFSKENKDERIIKLKRSLENLSCMMKNFDLEIINWIGYEKESKDMNIKNFHTRMFKVLKDENEVIRYCKEIKRVLVGDQQSNKIVEECPNGIDVTRSKSKTVGDLTENAPKDVSGDSDKQNRDIVESESDKAENTHISFDRGEVFDESKSFDKNIAIQDDDDDALSLFAESITGLESSRKNSSIAVSVSNDKTNTQPGMNESLQRNERVIQPLNNVEENEAPQSYSVKKQTADSSTVFRGANHSSITSKFQRDNSKLSVNIQHRYNDTCKVPNLGFSHNHVQNINDTAVNNKFNKSLFSNSVEFPDIQVRSPNKSENSSNRSSELQNPITKSFPYSCENNSFSQDISEIQVNASENCFDKAIENQGSTESIGGIENSNSAVPDVEQFNQSVANQLAMANKHIHVVATTVFKGVCIFNLVSNCKNTICTFPHKRINVDFVRSKLHGMNEETFIKESMYLLRWPILKHKYGMCFIEECIRRNLTIWLLHLIKDFVTKTNRKGRDQKSFSIEVTEATLLHLNEANMEPCADILRSIIKPNICLCDYLMKVISETQNFSRFKNVFIKLTLFMCQIKRSFSLDVATQFVERLCILPFDNALARALLKIMAKTNPSIFSNPMMGLLENQLSKNNTQLYKELINLKVQADRYSQNTASPPAQSPPIASSNVGYHTSTPIARADSPDTTNTDFVNSTMEPVITRTITINRTFNTSKLKMSVGSESSDEPMRRYEPRKPEMKWRSYQSSLMPLRPQRHVFKRLGSPSRAFNGSLPKFHRRQPHEPY